MRTSTRWPLLALAAGLAACVADGLGPFRAPRHAEHPLVGAIWSRTADAPVAIDALEARVRAARFVLLGEVHDHPDHHRLQARLLRAAAGGEPAPAVVFEMLDPTQQDAIDAFLAGGGRDPDAFAARVDWAGSGWPDFALYRPLFAAALESGLPLVAAGLSRGDRLAADAPERTAGFGLDEPLPPDERAARLDELFVGHCELVPREALGPMVAAQRARDARMALALLRAAERHGRAVLVAGNGHVRRGDVPALLARAGVARGEIVSVGQLEVDPERPTVAETAADRFDFTVFTPAAEREDPCDALRERFSSGTANGRATGTANGRATGTANGRATLTR